MHSPPVQPISSSSSGTGSVSTMWEEAIESRPRSGPRRPLAAPPIASTAARRPHDAAGGARLDPVGAPPQRAASARTRRPRPRPRSSRSRRPSARRAGCTVAASGKKTPPRKAGEAQRSATCVGAQLLRRVRLAQLAAGGDRGDGRVVEGLGGRDLEVAALAEPGVDPLVLAELADPVDRVLGGAGDRQRPLGAPALAHVRQREPHRRCRSRRCGRSARARRARPPRAGRRAPRARAPSRARPPTSPCSRRRRRRRRRSRSPPSGGAGSAVPASSSQ